MNNIIFFDTRDFWNGYWNEKAWKGKQGNSGEHGDNSSKYGDKYNQS